MRVAARDPQDFRDACAGAAAALDFFARQGLGRVEPFVVEVGERVPEEAGPSAAGCFIAERHKVYLKSYAAFRKARDWFGLPIDRDLYRALATHESAHALASCNFRHPKPPIQATEYVAYVTMLETLKPALRAKVLAKYPGTGFTDEGRITAVFYMFDPMRFGVEAWRHYARPGNGPAFLRRVLAGEAIGE